MRLPYSALVSFNMSFAQARAGALAGLFVIQITTACDDWRSQLSVAPEVFNTKVQNIVKNQTSTLVTFC